MDKGQEKRLRRRYTDEERTAILADAELLGVMEASRKHGVPQTTVSNWRTRSRKAGASERAQGRPAAQSSPSAAEQTGAEAPTPSAARGTATESPSGSAGVGAKRVVKRYTPSERAQILEYATEHSVLEASRKFGASRFSIYAWQRQVAKAARGQGPSPTSGPSQSEIEAQRDREILGEWRKHAGLGPSQIGNQLRRRGIKVGVATVRRVMEDAGYRPPKVKRDPHDERYESVRPNHRWHLDFVHRHIHRASTFTLILLDDHSRFVVGHGVDDAERAAVVIGTFEEAVARHGKPERVMHDRGAAFWSWRGISKFTALLTELGIDSEVATKKELNGKVEVFNANLHTYRGSEFRAVLRRGPGGEGKAAPGGDAGASSRTANAAIGRGGRCNAARDSDPRYKELFDVHRFYDLAEMKRRLASHLHFYNHGRTHHALGGLLVPADRYYGRAEEVLARIEAGGMRESDELELRDRALELFKVVSKNGVPEVWLLGQRLSMPLGM